jgi:DNA-binding NarL/FixJ family response regulator
VDGLAATRRILKDAPSQRVVILTTGDEDALGIAAFRAGAIGFLRKDVDVDALPSALLGAAQGEAVVSRRFTMRLIRDLLQSGEEPRGMRPVRGPLTSREWEIIDHLRAGKTTDEIADELVLARETVRSHVKNILRKLQVRSRREAIVAAEELRRSA